MVRQESNNTQADLADLRGARFAQTSETEEGQRLAQGKLKRITQGMGKIKAVRKYENPIEFPETHKLWIDTNRKPTIRDADHRPPSIGFTRFRSRSASQRTGLIGSYRESFCAKPKAFWLGSCPARIPGFSRDWQSRPRLRRRITSGGLNRINSADLLRSAARRTRRLRSPRRDSSPNTRVGRTPAMRRHLLLLCSARNSKDVATERNTQTPGTGSLDSRRGQIQT